jgi:hypothetical protein
MNEARLENELRKRNLQESKQIEILNRSESILKKSKSQALKSQSSVLILN